MYNTPGFRGLQKWKPHFQANFDGQIHCCNYSSLFLLLNLRCIGYPLAVTLLIIKFSLTNEHWMNYLHQKYKKWNKKQIFCLLVYCKVELTNWLRRAHLVHKFLYPYPKSQCHLVKDFRINSLSITPFPTLPPIGGRAWCPELSYWANRG